MKIGRATEAHMYHQAFRRSCRANARVWEGRHSGSGVRGLFAGVAAVEYAQRLYAAAERNNRAYPAPEGEGKVLIYCIPYSGKSVYL
jgi:hypothetical protein